MFTAEESLKFIVDKLTSWGSIFSRRSRAGKNALNKVFGDLTLRDTVRVVLIPCYDLRSGAPFLFSCADAMEIECYDFRIVGVCGVTVAYRATELMCTDGRKKIVAVGGGVRNPTSAAITHVLNNKQEFPLCKGVEDLLVVSLGNDSNHHA